MLPRTVWKPEFHWLVTVSWSMRAPEELPLWPTSTFRRTRGGRGLIPGLASHPCLCDINNPGSETEIAPDYTASKGMESPTSLAGCCLIKRSRAKRVAPLASFEVPPRPGRTGCHLRIRILAMYVLLQTPGVETGDPAGRYCSERRGNLHAPGWLLIGRGSC